MRYNYWIKDDFFIASDMNSLLKLIPCVSKCTKQQNKEFSRSRFAFPHDHDIHSIIEKYAPVFSELIGLECKFLPSVEFRFYQPGDKMEWHRDYDHCSPSPHLNPIFECVVTLHNTSDSVTEFRDEKTREVSSIKTTPNQLMALVRQGIYHRVSPLTKGERWICKFQFQHLGQLS